MPIINVFLLVGLFALILSFFLQARSAIWGGASIGFIIGIIVGFIKWDFSDIPRFALIGADFGLAAEIFGWIGDRLSGGSKPASETEVQAMLMQLREDVRTQRRKRHRDIRIRRKRS